MLTWNVYIGNHNRNEIAVYNVFAHGGFVGDCIAAAKKCKNDKAVFADELNKSLMYYYWSKCEWETVLSLWPPRDDCHDRKIDVYDQIKMNWDHFVNYVWDNREELKA